MEAEPDYHSPELRVMRMKAELANVEDDMVVAGDCLAQAQLTLKSLADDVVATDLPTSVLDRLGRLVILLKKADSRVITVECMASRLRRGTCFCTAERHAPLCPEHGREI